MKKTLKKVSALLTAAVALVLLLPLAASALEAGVGADFYVRDEAGVLSERTKESVYELNGRLEEQYGAQLVFVFLDYFGPTDPDELAVSLFNEWQVSDRGMLLVASVREGAGSMTVGSALTERFTPSDIDEVLDKTFADDFLAGRYDDAVASLSEELARWYDGEFGGNAAQTGAGERSGGFFGAVMNFLPLILLVVAVVAVLILSDRRRFRGYYASIGARAPRYWPWMIFLPGPYHRYRPPAPPPRSGHSGGTGGFGGFGPSSGFRSSSGPRSSSSGSAPRGGGMGGRSGGSAGGFRRGK